MGANERDLWSWAVTDDEVEERRRHTERLVGQRIRAVRYYTIDYRRGDFRPELVDGGPRVVDVDAEWEEPTWSHAGFDAVDFGVEFEVESGALFSLTWDPPGEREGIGLREVAMLGPYVSRDADVAIWSVGDRTDTWASVVGTPITGVRLHYRWEDVARAFWCPHITFDTAGAAVHVVLGDAEDGVLVPSSDNVAVLHPATPLPRW
ncbi:hypothetical protein ACQPYE_23435 [Actinosynnema sp. CA-299493]